MKRYSIILLSWLLCNTSLVSYSHWPDAFVQSNLQYLQMVEGAAIQSIKCIWKHPQSEGQKTNASGLGGNKKKSLPQEH